MNKSLNFQIHRKIHADSEVARERFIHICKEGSYAELIRFSSGKVSMPTPFQFTFCHTKKEADKILTLHDKQGLLLVSEEEKRSLNSEESLKNFLVSIRLAKAPIGLILAGGKSRRMGKSKAHLRYGGVAQYEKLAGAMRATGLDCYLSIRRDQGTKFDFPAEKIIYDKEGVSGPLSGILAAFEEKKRALLVLACDLPGVEMNDVAELINKRSALHYATAYHNPDTGFPDPLFTILEPISYHAYSAQLSLGKSCPRKLLINAPIRELKMPREGLLFNANSPEDKKRFLEKVKRD